MDILNPADLKSLIAQQGKWSISLYMQTHRMGREQQLDPIHLKNLLVEAETKLLANGLRRPQAEKLMRPAEGPYRIGIPGNGPRQSCAMSMA
ncbi:MAG: hypothetical protein WCC12_01415 [Anaerolineales bacterium]